MNATLGAMRPPQAGSRMNRVVAVAGPTGGGKSTLVRGLAAVLGNACAIHMDDYERMTREPAAKVMQWMARGAAFDELAIPLLAEHLDKLKRGEAVREPTRSTTIPPRETIVFETQFGRVHGPTGALVDYLIWIDIPLEVALARKVKSMLADGLSAPPADARARMEGVEAYLGHYMALVRPLLLTQAERVRPGADLVVDGTLPPPMLLRQACQALQAAP